MTFYRLFILMAMVIFIVGLDNHPKAQINENLSEIPNIANIIFKNLDSDDISMIRSNGTEPKHIAKGALKLSISPGQKLLALYYGKITKGWITYENSIKIYNSTDDSRFIVNDTNNQGLHVLSWSNDSKYVLFKSATNEKVLIKFSLNQKKAVSRTRVDAPILNFGFSKDNSFIVAKTSNPDCSGPSYLYFKYNNNEKAQTSTAKKIYKADYDMLLYSGFKEVIFHVYDYSKKYSRDMKSYLMIDKGDLIVNGATIYNYEGIYSPDFGYHGVTCAEWIANNLIVFELGTKLYIINTENKKVYYLTEGLHPIVLQNGTEPGA